MTELTVRYACESPFSLNWDASGGGETYNCVGAHWIAVHSLQRGDVHDVRKTRTRGRT